MKKPSVGCIDSLDGVYKCTNDLHVFFLTKSISLSSSRCTYGECTSTNKNKEISRFGGDQ
jgi:hypothetical protein